VDGADAGRGRRGGPAALLEEGITGLLTGGGGAADAIFVAIVVVLFHRFSSPHRGVTSTLAPLVLSFRCWELPYDL